MKKLVTILLFIAALYGSHEAKAQSSTPVSAGQCMQTNGSGGWTLAACGGGSSGVLNQVAPSGDTTGATDVTNINASCAAHQNAQLTSGNYYINSPIIMNNTTGPCRVIGAGSTTIINNKGTTNDWFRISYYTPWSEGTWIYPASTNQSEVAYMQFNQVGTPTAGYIFDVGSGIGPSGGFFYYTMNVNIHDTVANGAWGGAYFQDSQLYAFVHQNMWRQFVGGGAIDYNAQIGSGDNHFLDNEFSGLTYSGIIIAQSDTQMFEHNKLNGSGIAFTGAGGTKTVQFYGNSVETGISQPCAYDFGTGSAPINTQIDGGESFGFATLICHPANVSGLAYTIANSSATSDFAAGLVTNNGWSPLPTQGGLATASTPTFSPVGGTYGSSQSVVLACAKGTPSYQIGSGNVTQYSSAITVSSNETINAGCYGAGYNTLSTTSAAYIVGSFQDQASFAGTGGTLLSAYTTTAGKTFQVYSNSGTSPTIPQLSGSTSAVLPSGSDSTFGDSLDTLTPSSANYTVSLTCTRGSSGAPTMGVYARALTGSNTNYVFEFNPSGSQLEIFAQFSGTFAVVGSQAFTWNFNTAHTLALSVSGSTISATIDGTAMTGSPFTDTNVTATGQAGLRLTGGSDVTCTNFSVQ